MGNFFEILLSAMAIALFLLLVAAALVVAIFVVKLFSMLFKPITDPIHDFIENVSESVPNPLDNIHFFSKTRKYLGSPKNILFVCFITIFLIFYYLSRARLLSNAKSIIDNLFLLFPGSSLEQVVTHGELVTSLDISSFFVNPESYLRTIIFSFVTGLFLHIGCTTKAPDAKIHILVKLLYTLLISLFSSVVLGMIPSDMFIVSLPEISLDFTSAGIATGGSQVLMVLAEFQKWGVTLLKNLLKIIPTFVAIYFLSRSICGFTASYLGGFIALFAVGIGWPNGFSDPNSPRAVLLLLFILAVGEVIALTFSEIIDKAAEIVTLKTAELFKHYNIISLLISYFFYPAFALSLMCFLGILINGFNIALFVICLAGLLVFSLATFAGYKITSRNCRSVNGTTYAVAMVFNIPIWIIYIIIFIL